MQTEVLSLLSAYTVSSALPLCSVCPPQFFLSDDEHVAKQGKESPHSARKLDIVPHSAEGADNTDASSSEWVKSPVFSSAFTRLDEMKCFHQYSDWVRALGRDRTLRYTLYVAMSQASRGPAGHDLTDQSRSQLLREPYITCRYGRHNTPQRPQTLQMTFNFAILWGSNLGRNRLPCTFWAESYLFSEDLFCQTTWLKE